MNTKQIIPAFLVATLSLLAACSDDDKPNKPKPDANALHTFIEENKSSFVQTFTLDAEAGGQLKGTNGTTLEFPEDAFLTLTDGEVTGAVTIEFIEVYDRSSMLFSNMPTMGKNGDDDMAMLISGGEFYVNAKQGETLLKPASHFKIIAPTAKTGGDDDEMGIFKGDEECEGDVCNVVWEEEDRGLEIVKWQDTGGSYSAYYVIQSEFGWTNIDKWYNDPRPKTTIYVDVPNGFDNTNCQVFIVYDGEPTALGRMDVYDEEKGMFTEHYG